MNNVESIMTSELTRAETHRIVGAYHLVTRFFLWLSGYDSLPRQTIDRRNKDPYRRPTITSTWIIGDDAFTTL
jgi:hypothetical protein